MFTNQKNRTTTMLAAAALCGAMLAPGSVYAGGPAGTTITYQGQLQQNGSNVNGSIDFEFRLFSDEFAGSQVGSTVFATESVSDGVFTSQIDFGVSPYTSSQPLWLEIVADGETLSRQAVTSAPFSLATRGLNVNSVENVGIGTTSPARKLHVRDGASGASPSTNASLVVESSGEASISLIAPDDEEQSIFFGNPGTSPNAGAVVFNPFNGLVPQGLVLRTDDSDRIAITEAGLVGVGTSTPARQLHVRTGASGVSPSTNASLVVESSGEASISLIAPDDEEQSIFFGNPGTSPNAGGVVFNPFNGAVPQGLVLRTDDSDRLAITESGLIGIGTSSPARQLHVRTGASGASPSTNSSLVVESSGEASISLVAPSNQEQSIFFGNPSTTPNAGAIVFNPFGGVLTNGLVLRTNDTNRLAISSGGAVGINTITPSFQLEVNGSAGKPGGGSWSNSSDARLKKNIADLDGALDTLLALRGVTYEYKNPAAINELPGQRIGFIAQDVEQVIPDWIDEDANGYKRMTIRGFEALAVEALREQRTMIDDQQQQIDDLHTELAELKATMKALINSR